MSVPFRPDHGAAHHAGHTRIHHKEITMSSYNDSPRENRRIHEMTDDQFMQWAQVQAQAYDDEKQLEIGG